MKTRLALAASVVFFAACGESEAPATTTPAATEVTAPVASAPAPVASAPAPMTSAPMASAPMASAAVAATSGDTLGIPSCDQYLNEYKACLESAAGGAYAASAAAMKAGFDQTREAWKQAASNEATKAGLEAGCQQALSTLPDTKKALGC
jgi:hypothetical protein